MKRILSLCLMIAILLSMGVPSVCAVNEALPDETGYNLWLRYPKISDPAYREVARAALSYLVSPAEEDAVILSALQELQRGLDSLFGEAVSRKTGIDEDGAILVGTGKNPDVAAALDAGALAALDEEGYRIRTVLCRGKKTTVVAGGGPNGVLYGAFKLLEMIQCRKNVSDIDFADSPQIRWRVLDQWDNWNGSIERGYAGSSIYKWDELPDRVDGRYEDFARANASIGINTIVINNVTPKPTISVPKICRRSRRLPTSFESMASDWH